MENRWIAEIQNTPTPAEGLLTERALTQNVSPKKTSFCPYAFGGLALALTVPVVLILSPKKPAPTQETVKLAFVKANTSGAILNSSHGNSNTTRAIQTTASVIKNPTRANLNPTSANRITDRVIKNTTHGIQITAPVISNPTRAIKNPTRAKTIPPAAETQVALEIGKETENFGFRLPALEESVPEKPVRLRDDLATALQNEPTRETVKLQEVEELSLQQVTATEATSAPAARALLSLSTGLSPAVAKTLNRGEKRLRYPLTPLSKAPQATVKKAELSVHADSGHVAGNVALAPETTVRELLVAVFDQKGALVATTKELLPAKAEKVEIKPFVAPGASRYLLGLRPRFEREKSRLEIVGGYRGHERHVEVPAPPGVEIGVGDADFYQSNVHQDHFVRFSATLSKKLLKQPLGDPDLTLYGIVVDEKGALLSVASQPIKNKPDTHRYDLDFGLLPDGVGHEYKFVVTSAYRIVLTPDASFTVDSAKLESDGSLVLTPKLKEFPMADVLKKPELRDYTQVKLAPNVVKALKAKGLSEFVGLSVEASGRSERTLYTGFPAFVVTTVTVEKVDDVTFVG